MGCLELLGAAGGGNGNRPGVGLSVLSLQAEGTGLLREVIRQAHKVWEAPDPGLPASGLHALPGHPPPEELSITDQIETTSRQQIAPCGTDAPHPPIFAPRIPSMVGGGGPRCYSCCRGGTQGLTGCGEWRSDPTQARSPAPHLPPHHTPWRCDLLTLGQANGAYGLDSPWAAWSLERLDNCFLSASY